MEIDPYQPVFTDSISRRMIKPEKRGLVKVVAPTHHRSYQGPESHIEKMERKKRERRGEL